jgi:glutathione peroxidase-family protein
MKKIFLMSFMIPAFSWLYLGKKLIRHNVSTPKSIHKYSVKDINGENFDFAALKGKKVMIVNTASRCGYTKQFEGLQELYEKYKDQNFMIIGFPSNDFMNQDPGTNEEILEFCSVNYGVTFPMMSKVVVTGKNPPDLSQLVRYFFKIRIVKRQNRIHCSAGGPGNL